MQIDEEGPRNRTGIIEAMVEFVRDSRALRSSAPGTYEAIMPDWSYDLLTETDRQNLLALHDIRVRSRSEVRATEESL